MKMVLELPKLWCKNYKTNFLLKNGLYNTSLIAFKKIKWVNINSDFNINNIIITNK